MDPERISDLNISDVVMSTAGRDKGNLFYVIGMDPVYLTLAIEPMVNVGTHEVRVLRDGWTVVTTDGKLSAHYENTVLITDGEPEILTVTEGL